MGHCVVRFRRLRTKGFTLESTPIKLTKKRRRWLIVGIVLVMVSGVAWWNWPRGDARFVGKWEFRFVGTVNGRTPPERPGVTVMDLRSNGTAVFKSVGRGGDTPTTYALWSVENASLIIRIKDRISTHNVLSVEADEIDLSEGVKLVRIPE